MSWTYGWLIAVDVGVGGVGGVDGVDDVGDVGDVFGAVGLDDVSNVVASTPVAAGVVQAANDDVIGPNVSLRC